MKKKTITVLAGVLLSILLTGCDLEQLEELRAKYADVDISSMLSIDNILDEMEPETDASEEIEDTTTLDETTTIMIYMVGSDLESESGAATIDIWEILDSGIDISNNNIVIYTGGSTYWTLGVSADFNTVLEVTESVEQLELSVVAGTDEPENMGDSTTLSDFLNYAYEEYPADHYALICWNHGSGPVFGFGADILFEYDSLSLEEFDAAFQNSPFKGENKLDWIGFDACLMSSIEVASTLSSYAEYMIASQETEPGCGWNYSFLEILNQTTDPEKIAEEIIDDYVENIQILKSDTFNPDITLACLDLSKVKAVTSAMDDLFFIMADDLEQGGYSDMARSRENVKRYGMDAVSNKGESLDLVDLGSVAEGVSNLYVEESEKLLDAIDEMVIYQAGNVEEACGVSVYYPYDNQFYYLYMGQDLYEDISDSEGYTSYINKFSEIWLLGGDKVKSFSPKIKASDEEFTMQLTSEQLESFSTAYYTILGNSGIVGTSYYPIISECRIEPDENGLLHVSLNQNVLTATDKEGKTIFLKISQTESKGNTAKYCTQGVNFGQELGMSLGTSTVIENDVIMSFKVNSDTNDVVVQNIVSESEELVYHGKNDVTVDNWRYLVWYSGVYTPTYNDDSTIKPYIEWGDSVGGVREGISLKDGVELAFQPLSEFEGEFVCQIIVEDTYGNVYASELQNLPSLEKVEYTEYEQKTENGTLTYELHVDYAVLTAYEGLDEIIEIPSEVLGIPVTEISDIGSFHESLKSVIISEGILKIEEEAFSYNGELTEVSLPESITYIGNGAFAETKIEHIVIPQNIEYIGENPFRGDINLRTIELSSDNEFYCAEDNVLYSKEDKRLITAVTKGKTMIEIPEGIEIVGNYAFYGTHWIQKVSFPNSLKEIGDLAFYNTCFNEIKFNEGLEKIGHGAFYFWPALSAFDFEEMPQEIVSQVTIPENVIWIGECAFGGLPITQFVVDEDNEEYSAQGAFLMNKQGNVLLMCGGGMKGKVYIPEGISEISYNAFEGCNFGSGDDTQITDLYLPNSLLSIKGDLPDRLESLTIGDNLKVWTTWEYLDETTEVIISEKNTAFKVENNKVVEIE